jgi:site-specific DNA recombinase
MPASEPTDKIALYIRVSTNEQAAAGYSLGEQEARLRAYCTARGWSNGSVETFCDAGVSGSTLARPALQRLVAQIQETSEFASVLVYKLDRLSRSQKDTLYLLEDVFAANNVAFASLNESFDTATPFGRATVGIMSAFAQLEREQIKERMALGRMGRIKTGRTSAWAVPPFGYRYINGYLQPDPQAAAVVQEMFAAIIAGETVGALARRLNARGPDGHPGKSKPWSYRTAHLVLSNAVYTGVTNYRGAIYPGLHTPIIAAPLYDQVQHELTHRRHQALAHRTPT